MTNMNVFLIEPNQLSREGLRQILSGCDITMVGEAANAGTAGPVIGGMDLRPDLILIEPLSMAEDVRALRALSPQSRIVVLASDLCIRSLSSALAEGVHGYLTKSISSEALIQSLQLVMMGETVFPTNLADIFISGRMLQPRPVHSRPQTALSPREIQMLRCLISGLSNKAVASQLGITEATVKVHLKNLLRKIKVLNRTQAAIWAMNHGFEKRSDASNAEIAMVFADA
ncbi:response regulator transcription factor [Azospirillum sp. SYSU D00513]|uniref:LuxR C-terminal-related transcriptional regulator n=1 Tax=Azospirillum sp. SYSU D00513 TaxID=2812561 RepID=UPI001A95CA64|nr:response regulator transcription factor [Azospirillum sp. SYSU D00513]